MVLGWRRAFCTSVPRERDSTSMTSSMEEFEYEHVIDNGNGSSCGTTKLGRRFGFFSSSSNPSTPPLRSQSVSSPSLRCRTTVKVPPAPSSSVPVSPKLHCETKNSPRCFLRSSTPSSPRSPSPFTFLKSSLRLCTRRCGLCLQSVKKGNGMASFTAECSHCFHFPCISDHVKKQGSLACPVCSCLWKDMPLLSVDEQNQKHQFVEEEERIREKLATRFFMEDVASKNESPKQQPLNFKVYNDDEPLASLTPKARFIAIPESDETCDEESIDEFQGFYVKGGNNTPIEDHARDVDVRLLPDAAVIASSRRHESYAIVLKVKAPPAPEKTQRRAPIDLVTVVDVSGKMTCEKLQIIKRAMRSIVSALSSKDRLSIVAFSSYSKRLLPLRRMTTTGRRAARRIVEAMAVLEGSSNSKDAAFYAIFINLFADFEISTNRLRSRSVVNSYLKMSNTTMDVPKTGFSFDLCRRNDMLAKKGLKPPGYLKTGTTIVGLIFENGVILGADTRATEGPIVADKNCEKIHYMAPNIYCCGAGTAADTEAVTDNISSQLKLHRYHTGRESRVVTALTLLKSHLFRYQGHVSAALVLGGVDVTGPHLHTIYPHGSTDTLPFATMGSGSLAAMAIFESEYREGLTRDEGVNLVTKAICSGIFNDLGSGSNVDVCVIEKGKKEYLRNHLTPNPRTYISERGYTFSKKAEVLLTRITPLKELVEVVQVGGDAMEE